MITMLMMMVIVMMVTRCKIFQKRNDLMFYLFDNTPCNGKLRVGKTSKIMLKKKIYSCKLLHSSLFINHTLFK